MSSLKMLKKYNFGTIRPIKLVKGKNIILFNPYTGQVIFTNKINQKFIALKEINKLKNGIVNIQTPKLRKFRIESTLKCNCACDYCLVYKNKIPQIGCTMNLTTAKKITREFNNKIRGGSLMIIGGEPLLNKDVLNYFMDHIDGSIKLYTNAILIDKEYAQRLKKRNVRVYVSFDGWKKLNFHRKDLAGKPSYETSLKGYLLLKKAGVETAITCLATNDNVNYLFDIIKYFHQKYGETNFGISIPHYTKENNFKINIKKYTSEMIKIFDYAKEKGIYVDQLAKRLFAILAQKPRYYSCKLVGEQKTFYPDGKTTLCTKLDTLEQFKKKNKSFYELKLPYNSLDCKNCNALSICGGGCFWDAIFNDSGRDRRDCYFNKNILLKILQDMSIHAQKNKVIMPAEALNEYKNMLGKLYNLNQL